MRGHGQVEHHRCGKVSLHHVLDDWFARECRPREVWGEAYSGPVNRLREVAIRADVPSILNDNRSSRSTRREPSLTRASPPRHQS